MAGIGAIEIGLVIIYTKSWSCDFRVHFIELDLTLNNMLRQSCAD